MAIRPSRLLPERFRLPALLIVGVLAISGGVWLASYAQREASSRVARQARNAQLMLTAMLDQETGLRGYLLNDRIPRFLEPYEAGRRRFDSAVANAREAADGDDEMLRSIAASQAVARNWQRLAEEQIAKAKSKGFTRPSIPDSLARKEQMDRFRALNADFGNLLEARRAGQLREAGVVAVVVSLGLGVTFGLFGTLLIRRTRTARERDREFAENLPVMRSEAEAHKLLRHHIERVVPGTDATVLTRNNSADRLVAATEPRPGDPLIERLENAEPGSCLAVRLMRRHTRDTGTEPLLGCELCGGGEGGSVCQPLLVSGEVLGAVLMRKTKGRVAPVDEERLAESVSRAAPALANLRNLAVAEIRAQTDALTGLANRRAIQDTLKRLHAQAARTNSPLSLVVVDLDHFKKINDTYGHDRGDEALAAAAGALSGSVRLSDFTGRMGGEEFIVMLPDTDVEDAVGVAEKLRLAIRALRVRGLHDGLSASFGVATFPDHAAEPETLLRLADRALYLAKNMGRDRVERAGEADSGVGTPAQERTIS